MKRDDRTGSVANETEGRTATASAPGKRALTARLPVQRKAAPEPTAPTPTSALSPPVWERQHEGADDPFGLHLLGDARQVQAKGDLDGDDVHAHAAYGISGAPCALPYAAAIQASFGSHDVSGIQAHVGGAAAEAASAVGATAYATGTSVAFASTPDLHTAAHEATHVVQQRGGVQLEGGVGEAGDRYEQHADAVADAVVAGRSATALLDDTTAPGGGSAGPGLQRNASAEAKDAPAAKPSDDELPPGVLYKHVPGTMSIRVRTAWLDSGDPFARNLELLNHLRDRGVLAWATADGLAAAARGTRIAPGPAGGATTRVVFSANVYTYVGLPPGTQASISGWGEALTLAIAAPQIDVEPGPETRVPLSPAQIAAVVAAVEEFTHLAAVPEARRALEQVSGHGGRGVFTARLTRETLDALFGHDAYQDWLDQHRGKPGSSGARDVAIQGAVTDLTPLELDYVKAWLAAHLPHAAGAGGHLDRELRKLIAEIEASPYRKQILAAMALGDSRSRAVNAITLRDRVAEAIFEATAAAEHIAPPTERSDLEPVWPVAVPARFDQQAGQVVSGEDVPVRLLITLPPDLMNQDRLNELRFRPFVTSIDWVFEKISGDLEAARPPTVLERGLHITHGAKTQIWQQYTGIAPQSMPMRFVLGPHEQTAIWKATAFVRHSHFQPAIIPGSVTVMSEERLMGELRADATDGMGTPIMAPKDFDTGFLNNRFGKNGTDLGEQFYGTLPDDWKARTSKDRDGHRTSEMNSLRAMIAHLREHNPGGDNGAAIDAAERYLARLARADQAIERDEAAGWQPFEIRGTFLSRQPGVGDGALDLYGMVKREEDDVATQADLDSPAPAPRGRPVKIQLRDLSRRFDVDDRTLHGEGATFEAALEAAFVKLCKSYPAGRVFVLAQVHGGDGTRATNETVGFELGTGSVGKDVKAAVFDPIVNTAVNLAGMAMMIFLPGSAVVVMPALIVYNATHTIDELHTKWVEGNLTAKDITLGVASLGLDLLPYLGRARALAGSKKALLILEGVDLAGEAVYMTAAGLDQARALQEHQVKAMASLYERLIELQAKTHPSDPQLLAMQDAFDQQAAEVRKATARAFLDMVEQRAFFVGAKHVFRGIHLVGTPSAVMRSYGGLVEQPGEPPRYDRDRGQIVGDPRQLDDATMAQLMDEHAAHMRDLAVLAAGDLGVDPAKVEVVLDSDVNVSIEPGRVRLGYSPKQRPDQARASWQRQAAAARGGGGGRRGKGDEPRPDGSGDPGAAHTPPGSRLAARVDEVGRPVSLLVSGVRHDGGSDFVLDVGKGAVPVRVVVGSADLTLARVKEDGDGHRIELPPGLAPADVEVVLAAKLTEVSHIERRHANGQVEATTNALGANGQGTAFSPADFAMVGELRALQRQRRQAEQQGAAGAARIAEFDEKIRILEDAMGFNHEVRGAEVRQMVEAQVGNENDAVRRDLAQHALDGDRGHAGIEVHTHWMGIVDIEVFRAKAAIAAHGKDDGSWVPLLTQIAGLDKARFGHTRAGEAGDGPIEQRSAAGDAVEIARDAWDQVRALRERSSDPETASDGQSDQRAAEILSEDAVRHALAASPETDFNSAYEIRDELVKDTFAGTRHADESVADFQNRGYDQYTREALLALAHDGVGYTEPSNSFKKMKERFGEARIARALDELIAEGRLQPGQLDLRFLTMVTTNHFGWRPDDAPSIAVPEPKEGQWELSREEMQKQLLQKYVGGIDIAGQEFFWFDPDLGGARFRQLYADLLEAATTRGERLVLRPHVGEGAIDTAEGQPYGRDDHRARSADGQLSHYPRAQHNLEVVLTALEDLQAKGRFDGTKVEVRFGHATHATPAQVVRMRALGITAEINLGSNVASGALDQTEGGVDGKPQPLEQYDDHALPTLLYYDARAILSTDAHAVMSTTMRAEYQRARRIIDELLSGARRVRVRATEAGTRGIELPGSPGDRWLAIHELTPDERSRFTRAYEKLYADAESYYQRRPGAEAVGATNSRSDASPVEGRHFADLALEQGLVASHGTRVFKGSEAAVRAAADAYRRARHIVHETEDRDDRLMFFVRSGEGDVDLELHAAPDAPADHDPDGKVTP